MRKISIIASLLFLFFVQHTFAQRLISDSLLRHFTQAQLRTYFTNNGVPFTPATGIKCYRVVYETLNAKQTDTTIASGLVVVPDDYTCPLPIAMYDHGTVLQRNDVPSFMNYEALIPMLIAANGYYAIAPDYLGLGLSPGFHPYVHARSEAQAGIDLIFAAKTFAVLDTVALNSQLFLTGYSQGGHACMATHRAIEQNYAGQLTVTASAPGSGPYNLSGIQSAGLASDSFYADPAYIPYLIFAYQSVYGNLYDSVQQFLVHPYDSILPPLYNELVSTTTIDALMPHHIDSIVVAGQLTQYLNDSINDPLRIDLRDNDVYAWVPEAPVLMTYCTLDEQVNYESTLFTENYFLTHGDTTARDANGGPGTHEDCVTPAIQNMLSFFNSYKISENNLTVTLTADSESTAGAGNASVTVLVSGGANYHIHWSTGDSVATVTGLHNGTYTVTVTDAKGCTKVRSITTNNVTGIAAISAALQQVQIFPNPATGLLTIKTTGFQPQHIAIYNAAGQLVTETGYIQQLNIGNLATGVYVIQVTGANAIARSRFVKM